MAAGEPHSAQAAIMHHVRARYATILSPALSLRTAMSEAIGVFGFVMMGCGAAALTNAPEIYDPESSRMGKEAIIGYAFGFGITFMIYATAHNNAGQLNPAVTLSLVAAGVQPLAQALLNICAQIFGAIAACGILDALVPDPLQGGPLRSALGGNKVPDEQTKGKAFLAEWVGAFIAIFVVLEAVCNPRTKAGNLAPLAIGLAFGTLLMVLSPFSSGSFNPARSLGPAAITHEPNELWIYIVAPILGGLSAVPFHLASVGLGDAAAASAAKHDAESPPSAKGGDGGKLEHAGANAV